MVHGIQQALHRGHEEWRKAEHVLRTLLVEVGRELLEVLHEHAQLSIGGRSLDAPPSTATTGRGLEHTSERKFLPWSDVHWRLPRQTLRGYLRLPTRGLRQA